MPATKAKESKQTTKPASQAKGRSGATKRIIAVVGLIIIIAAIAGALAYAYGPNSTQQASFLTFRSNFGNAARVAIYAVGNNSTSSGVIMCSDQLIYQLVTSASYHRNASAIDIYYMNGTSCYYSQGVLGSGSASPIKSTPAECLSLGSAEPRIYINYSASNSSFVTPDALYLHGNLRYLEQCGIASEITSG